MGNFSFHEKKSLVLIVVMSMSEAFNSVAFYFTASYSTAYYSMLWSQNSVVFGGHQRATKSMR